jgi:hypothetical protein
MKTVTCDYCKLVIPKGEETSCNHRYCERDLHRKCSKRSGRSGYYEERYCPEHFAARKEAKELAAIIEGYALKFWKDVGLEATMSGNSISVNVFDQQLNVTVEPIKSEGDKKELIAIRHRVEGLSKKKTRVFEASVFDHKSALRAIRKELLPSLAAKKAAFTAAVNRYKKEIEDKIEHHQINMAKMDAVTTKLKELGNNPAKEK